MILLLKKVYFTSCYSGLTTDSVNSSYFYNYVAVSVSTRTIITTRSPEETDTSSTTDKLVTFQPLSCHGLLVELVNEMRAIGMTIS